MYHGFISEYETEFSVSAKAYCNRDHAENGLVLFPILGRQNILSAYLANRRLGLPSAKLSPSQRCYNLRKLRTSVRDEEAR